MLNNIVGVSSTLLTVLPPTDSSRPSDGDVDLKFQQCRQYLELNERLQEVRGRLVRQREELRTTGEKLDRDVAEVKGQPLWLYTTCSYRLSFSVQDFLTDSSLNQLGQPTGAALGAPVLVDLWPHNWSVCVVCVSVVH